MVSKGLGWGGDCYQAPRTGRRGWEGALHGASPAGQALTGSLLSSKLHCMRNYIHMNLFASFILKGISVLIIDTLLKTRYNEKIDDYSVRVWLSDEVTHSLHFSFASLGSRRLPLSRHQAGGITCPSLP